MTVRVRVRMMVVTSSYKTRISLYSAQSPVLNLSLQAHVLQLHFSQPDFQLFQLPFKERYFDFSFLQSIRLFLSDGSLSLTVAASSVC